MRGCKLNKEELLQLVKDFHTKNGRSPKLKEIKQVNGFPNIKVYYRIFETTTWNDILGLVGLDENRTTRDMHTRDSLKQLLIEYHNKYNKVPTSKELGSKIGIPSGVVFYDRFGTKSWNEILMECGLPLNHYQGYTKDGMIETLKDVYVKYGKIPTHVEWGELGISPNHGQYARVFGSIENACVIAGLIEKSLTKEEKIKNSIKKLEELARELGRVPKVFEFEKKLSESNGACLNRRGIEQYLKINYNNICRQFIPQYNLNIDFDYDENIIKQEFQRVYNILGRAPKFSELKSFGIIYTIPVIAKYLNVNTYNDAIEKMGWVPSAISPIIKSENQLLNEFYNYFLELNRVPYAHEMDENKNISSYETYNTYFGGIENICNLLNIDMNKYYIPCNGSWTCYDNDGSLCRSKKELEITNFLIHNKIKYKKEIKYMDIMPEIKNRIRLDWVVYIDDVEYYVEYLGMYDHNLDCIKEKYREKTMEKIEYLKKYNKWNNSIFIYPDDLKKNKISEIFNNKLNKNYTEYISSGN